jgi:hypothetical protein
MYYSLDLINYLKSLGNSAFDRLLRDPHFFNTNLLYRSSPDVLDLYRDCWDDYASLSNKKILENLIERHPSEIGLDLFSKFFV